MKVIWGSRHGHSETYSKASLFFSPKHHNKYKLLTFCDFLIRKGNKMSEYSKFNDNLNAEQEKMHWVCFYNLHFEFRTKKTWNKVEFGSSDKVFIKKFQTSLFSYEEPMSLYNKAVNLQKNSALWTCNKWGGVIQSDSKLRCAIFKIDSTSLKFSLIRL